MNSENQAQVRRFHEKHGFPVAVQLSDAPHTQLNRLACLISDEAKAIEETGLYEQKNGDPRAYRTHLILEEVAEFLLAAEAGDEEKVADALGDLLYVVYGAGVTWNIPLGHVFNTIHCSNMSKQLRTNGNERMRDKGPDYRKPDISGAIKAGRV